MENVHFSRVRSGKRVRLSLWEKVKLWFVSSYSPMIHLSLMFLIFFQLASELLQATFVLALLDKVMDINMLYLLGFISPFLFLLLPRRLVVSPKFRAFLSFLVLGCRSAVVAVTKDTGRVQIACAGVGTSMLFIVATIQSQIENVDSGAFFDALQITRSVVFGITLNIVLRTIGLTVDPTMTTSWARASFQYWIVVGWAICIAVLYMSLQLSVQFYEGGHVLRRDKLEETIEEMKLRVEEARKKPIVVEEEEEEAESSESESSEESDNGVTRKGWLSLRTKKKRQSSNRKKKKKSSTWFSFTSKTKPKTDIDKSEKVKETKGGVCGSGLTWSGILFRARRRVFKPVFLAIGISVHLFLLQLVIAVPTVTPAWSHTIPYSGILLIQLGSAMLIALSFAPMPNMLADLHLNIKYHIGRIVATSWNIGALMVAATMLNIGNPLQRGAGYIFLATSPVIYINLLLLLSEFMLKVPSKATTAIGFTTGGILYGLLIFMEWSVTYYESMAHSLRFFRDRYYAFLAVAIGTCIVSLYQISFNAQHEDAKRKKEEIERLAREMEELGGRRRRLSPEERKMTEEAERDKYYLHRITMVKITVALILVVGCTGFALAVQTPILGEGVINPTEINVMSYNVHFGIDMNGNEAYGKIGDKLWALHQNKGYGPFNLIGIQAGDTSKLSLGNSNLCMYLAAFMNMDYYLGPPPASGSYGVCLLSSHEIKNGSFHLLPRTVAPRRQVPVLKGIVRISGKDYNVLNVLFDPYSPLNPQIMELRRNHITARDVILLTSLYTDFSLRPMSPYQEIITTTNQTLRDSWYTLFKTNIDREGRRGFTFAEKTELSKRYDYIFISPTLNVTQSTPIYDFLGPSDHVPLTARLIQLKEWDIDCKTHKEHPLC